MNKDKHVKHFHDQREHFSPFLISIGGIIVKEALVLLANLSQLMAEKMDEPISHLRG